MTVMNATYFMQSSIKNKDTVATYNVSICNGALSSLALTFLTCFLPNFISPCVKEPPNAARMRIYHIPTDNHHLSILLVSFPDPTRKHAIPYPVILSIIAVLMVLYFIVVLQILLYVTSKTNTPSRRFCANWEDNLTETM